MTRFWRCSRSARIRPADLALALDEDNGDIDSTLQMLVQQGHVDRLTDWRWRLTSMTGPALMRDAKPVTPRQRPPKPMAVPIDDGRVQPIETSITRLIDGVEFEVTFDGRGETHDWPVGWGFLAGGLSRDPPVSDKAGLT